MAKKQINPQILIEKEYFIPEKTNDVFMEVEFDYGGKKWDGVLPKFLEKQGLDLTDEEFNNSIEENYNLLSPTNKKKWIIANDEGWKDKTEENYKVISALYSGEWECRTCGVAKINDQPPARIRALKIKGYIIGSKRKHCTNCGKKTMHDILIMLPKVLSKFEDGNELRAPMSDKFKERVKRILGKREVCFNTKRSSVELLVDHKFPSQRWIKKESANPDDMPEAEIRKKFQLLSNQTNMWKSRICDACVRTGKRGDFMGLKWYYQGDENWNGATENDENGCVGCPWYDLQLWKQKLGEEL